MTSPIPITAVALSGRLDLDALAPPPGFEVALRQQGLIIFRREGVGLWFYDFGAAVAEHHTALSPALRALIESVTGLTCMDPTTETLTLLLQPDAASGRPRVGWDRVVIKRADADTLDAIAHLMAQSAALDRYALEADELLIEVLNLARGLETLGRLPFAARELERRIGHILARRLELARWFYTQDRPESAWRDPDIYELHEALADNLELRERQASILHKLEAIEESLDTITDLWHGHRALSLEWAIVILIVIEIVGALLGAL